MESAKTRYRELLAHVMADSTVTPQEEEQLDELTEILSLPRRLTRQLQREATRTA